MHKEKYEQRLFRIFSQAGYSPARILTITSEEMVEIPDITIANIRAVLCVQNKVLSEKNRLRAAAMLDSLLESENNRDE